VRNVIAHDHTNHPGIAKVHAAATASSDNKNPAADDPDSTACTWEYGSGVVAPESVSDLCFGAGQTTDKHMLLEDIARNIVDEDSVERLYRHYDAKTDMLVQCRRSDRMIDETMNRIDFDATPVLLHCGHTVCRGCAYTCVRAHENAKYDTLFAMVNCPTRCDRETVFVCDLGVEWLPVDIRRIRLLQQHSTASNQMCSGHNDRVATARCTHASCAEFPLMCAECDKTEHSTRNARDHVRVSPSQIAITISAASDSLCAEHQQPLSGVCMTDGVPVCGECLYDHLEHEVKQLHEICSEWSKKLEALQRETLVKAHILGDRAVSVQRHFDAMVGAITTCFGTISRNAQNRQNKLLFEARRWRKMQLEQAKMLAADSSQLSATAMYENMLLQRALGPCADDHSDDGHDDDSKSHRPVNLGPSSVASTSASTSTSMSTSTSTSTSTSVCASASASVSASASASASASVSASVSASASAPASASASSYETISDVILGGIARQVHASGSAIEAESTKLDISIAAMQAENMNVTLDSAILGFVLHSIESMGKVTIDATVVETDYASSHLRAPGPIATSADTANTAPSAPPAEEPGQETVEGVPNQEIQ
jgi:B-box zinc finger